MKLKLMPQNKCSLGCTRLNVQSLGLDETEHTFAFEIVALKEEIAFT